MTAFVFAVIVPLACIIGWVYGEMTNNRPSRLIGAVGCVISSSIVAATVAGLHASLSVGIPLGNAFHAYIDTASEQIRSGNTAFVVQRFAEFSEEVPATYESGALLQRLKAETQRMEDGPATETHVPSTQD